MAIDICCVLQVWLVGEDGENDFHEYENGDDFKDIKILIIIHGPINFAVHTRGVIRGA